MSKLLSNGCSFLTSRNKDGVVTFTTQILADNYDIELVNLAMGGRGNTRISFSTKVWCEQNKDENVFAVIGWSSSIRNDYVTDDGWVILAGRNNKENDFLTHRNAEQNDFWFHAHGYPGSHVILKRDGRKDEPSKLSIEQAAAVAAFWSKGKTAKKLRLTISVVEKY